MIPDNFFDKLDNLLKPRVIVVNGKEWHVGVQTLFLPTQYRELVDKYYPNKFNINQCASNPTRIAVTKRK